MKDKIVKWGKQTVIAVLTILLALVIGARIGPVIGGMIHFEAYESLFTGAFGSKQRISRSLLR